MAVDAGGMATNAASGAAAGSTFGPWGAAIGGAAGIASSLIGAHSASKAAGASWKQQVLMAMFQRDWEKQKMQNSYQWTVQDMEKAGLNPMLAYQNGSNNAGGVSAGAGDTTGLQSAGQIMAKGLANIVPVASQIYSGLKGTENQTIQTEADAVLKKATAINTIEETKHLSEKMKSEIVKNIADAGKTKNIEEISEPASKVAKGISKIIDTVKDAPENIYKKAKREATKKMYSAKNAKEAWKNIL